MRILLQSLFFASLSLILFSCDNEVRFTSDQPNGIAALPEVPTALRGVWVSETDSLFVNPKQLVLVRTNMRGIALADTARNGLYRNASGKLAFKSTKDQRILMRETSDSAYYMIREQDRYLLGKDTILKSWKGDYYLNMKTGAYWQLMQLTVHKKKLSVSIPAIRSDESVRIQRRMDERKSNVDSSGLFAGITPFHRLPKETKWFYVSATTDQLLQLQRRGLFRPIASFQKVR